MAETEDRAALLAEAYKRGILPPDVKASYEEAMSRGLVQKPEAGGGLRQRAGEFFSGANDAILGVPDKMTAAMQAGQAGLAKGLATMLPNVPGTRTPEQIDAMAAQGRTETPRVRDILPTVQPTDATGRVMQAAGRAVPETMASAAAVPGALAAIAPGAGKAAQPIIQGVSDMLRLNSAPAMLTQGVAAAGGGAGGQVAEEMAPGNALAKFLGTILGGGVAGAGANALEGAARRAISPTRSVLNPAEQRLADVAKAEGIGLTPAQETGSRPLQTLESVFKSLPLTAGPQREIADTQTRQFNAAVLKRAGIDSDRATPEILRFNTDRLSKEFQRISAATVMRADDQFLDDVQTVATRYATKMPSQQREVVDNWIKDILATGDSMPGAVYQQARSDLTRQVKSTAQNDPTLSHALKGLRDALDNAADRSIPEPLRDAWSTARSQWAAKSVIERAMSSGGGAQAASGNIPPGSLSAAVSAGNRGAFAEGRGQMTDLARIGEKFIRDPIANSGTQERTTMANLLTGAGAGSGILSGDPLTALAMPAVALGLPRLLQAGYNSGPVKNYLTNTAASRAQPDNAAIMMARQLMAPRL